MFGICPNGCSSTGLYAYGIPIKTRGDTYNPWGHFWVATSLSSSFDIGKSDDYPNTLRISEATMTDFAFTNNECNTVD